MPSHLSHGGWPAGRLPLLEGLPLLEEGLSVVLAGGLSRGKLEAGEGGEDLLVGVIRVIWKSRAEEGGGNEGREGRTEEHKIKSVY